MLDFFHTLASCTYIKNISSLYLSLNDWFDKKRFEIEEENEREKNAHKTERQQAKRDTTNLNLDLY